MGNTPSAATAADLLGMLTLACTMTLRSSKRALWIFLLCAAFCAFNATAMDGNNAAPGHAWTPGRHIIAMPESGHPAIMDGTFGAPYWRALRPRMIQFLVADDPEAAADSTRDLTPSSRVARALELLHVIAEQRGARVHKGVPSHSRSAG